MLLIFVGILLESYISIPFLNWYISLQAFVIYNLFCYQEPELELLNIKMSSHLSHL